MINSIDTQNSSSYFPKDLNAINSFISKLPNLPSRSSIQPMIKKIYSICMNIRSEERTSENLQVLKTILESAREYSYLLNLYSWFFYETLFFTFADWWKNERNKKNVFGHSVVFEFRCLTSDIWMSILSWNEFLFWLNEIRIEGYSRAILSII